MKRLIQNGTVVSAEGVLNADVLIQDWRISAVGLDLAAEGAEVIDATGCYVLPGGIDVHTHFNIDVGIARSCDDFFSGTRAAACGGTTTIIDHMGFGPVGCSLHHQLEVYHHAAAGQAVIDYSFHGVIQHVDEAILDEMRAMVDDEGISSFKFYLTYGHKLNDTNALQALTRLGQIGALATVHPENDAAIAARRTQLLATGHGAPIDHARSRPLECEAEAIARMINLARLAGDAPLYIVHLSNGLGLDYLRLARAAKQPVWVETCPQYLLLDESHYLREDGLKFILSPPLRPHIELEKLWAGVMDGSIDTVATDHCTFPYQQRQKMAQNDFSHCPNGLPGVENRMALLFSEGVMQGRISVSRYVDLTSTMPAKLFGLWPRKGNLAVGADADIVIIDPRRSHTLCHGDMHDNADYSPYEGMQCQGMLMTTLSRGEVVAHEGQFTGVAGAGQFLARKPFDLALVRRGPTNSNFGV
ncbi:MAG: dihydropyrimidinase [Rhodoferax sp.]|nr:dihydropyrimidinase [Rhodoferax sp.]